MSRTGLKVSRRASSATSSSAAFAKSRRAARNTWKRRQALLAVYHFRAGNTATQHLGHIDNHGAEEMACHDLLFYLQGDEATAGLPLDILPQRLPLIFETSRHMRAETEEPCSAVPFRISREWSVLSVALSPRLGLPWAPCPLPVQRHRPTAPRSNGLCRPDADGGEEEDPRLASKHVAYFLDGLKLIRDIVGTSGLVEIKRLHRRFPLILALCRRPVSGLRQRQASGDWLPRLPCFRRVSRDAVETLL